MNETDWFACTNPHEMLKFLDHQVDWKQRLVSWLGLGALAKKNRKSRLFACACCRRIWQLLADERSRRAVETSERYADGLAGKKEVQLAMAGAADAAARAESPRLAVGPWLLAAQARAADAATSALDQLQGAHQTATWAREAARAWAKEAPGQWAKPIQPATPAPQSDWVTWLPDGANTRSGVRIPLESVAGEAAWQVEGKSQCDLLRDIFGNPFRAVAISPAWKTPAVVELARTIYQVPSFERLAELAQALEAAGCNNPDILSHCRQPGEHIRGCWLVDLILGN